MRSRSNLKVCYFHLGIPKEILTQPARLDQPGAALLPLHGFIDSVMLNQAALGKRMEIMMNDLKTFSRYAMSIDC